MEVVRYWRLQNERYNLKGTVNRETGEKQLFFRPQPIGYKAQALVSQSTTISSLENSKMLESSMSSK